MLLARDVDFKGTTRFAVRRRLGAGGMGVVYESFDYERNAVVALKTLLHLDAEALYRFKNEFRALADLEHPNLVRLGELHCDDGRWFFTMELVEGQSFMAHVRPGEAPRDISPSADTLIDPPRASTSSAQEAIAEPSAGFDERRLRAALVGLARGLAVLHAAGKVHRDVKPSNILVTPEDRVVLLDFGLVTDASQSDSATDVHVVGTALYMAPEQAASRPVGPEADWYAVGCVLYEALTGRTPFAGAPLDVLMDKQRYEPPPPRQLVPDVPRDLDALCADLLRFEPRARPPEAQILARLGAAETPAAAAPRTTPPRVTAPPFVGREPELAALRAAFEGSRKGRALTLLVHGESGVGKTALVRRFLDDLEREDPRLLVLAGRCYERESLPFKAFDGIVDQLSHHLARLDPVRAALLLPQDVALLARVFPVLRRLPALAQVRQPSHDIRDPQQLRTRAFGALRRLLAQIIETRPVAIFIDDLQWADADSLVLLADLMHPVDAPALLLVATTRPVEIPSLELGERRDLHLEGLPRERATELATLLGGADAGAIADETGGHPLFIQELVRYAAAMGDRGRGELRLEEALAARIDRLEARAHRLLDTIAVAGAPIAQRVAAQAAGLEFPECASLLSFLRAAYLVRTGGLRDADVVEPYHDRVRETIVAALDVDARREHHRALAAALEVTGAAAHDPRALVRHLEASGETERAAHQATTAARAAGEALAFDQAAELYEIALRLGHQGEAERRKLQFEFAEALVNAGRSSEAAEVFLGAAEGAEAGVRLDCRRRAMEQFLVSGHPERGLDTLAQVLAEIGVRMPRTSRGALASLVWQRLKLRLRGLGWKQRDTGQIPAEDLMRLEIFRGAGHGLTLVDTVRASDFNTRALLLALRLGEPSRLLLLLASEAVFAAGLGRSGCPRAHKLMDRIRRMAAQDGGPLAQAWSAGAMGVVSCLTGRFADAKRQSIEAEALFQKPATGAHWELSTAQLFLAFSLMYSGALAELAPRFDACMRDAARRGDRYLETTLSRSCCLIWLARDDVEGARRELDARSWAPPQGGYHLQHWLGLRARAEIDLYTGAPDALERARAGLEALERSLHSRVQIVRADSRWLHGRLALAAADVGTAARMARRLEREKVPYARVWALLLRAGVAAHQGEVARACEHLNEAASLGQAEELLLCAAAARWRRGQLLGGQDGAALVADGEAWMAAQGIKNPARLGKVIVP